MSFRTILPLGEYVMSKALRCLIFGALLTVCATHAKADALTLTITNPTQTITYGQLDQFGVAQVSFIGNLSDSTNQQITIGTPGQPCCDPFSYHLEITQQSTQLGIVYNPQFPTTVGGLTTLNGLTLFTINVPLFTNVPAHTITGTFTVHYYLPGGDVQIASGNITINVPAGISAPEPATLALFATGIAGLSLRKRRRRGELARGKK
jgi:hypothetical protein